MRLGLSMAITSISPPSGLPGSTVLLTGQRLFGATAVRFNGIDAVFTADSEEQITVTVPAGATTGVITIVHDSGTTTSTSSFNVLIDTDGDGMPDSFEQLYFNHPTSASATDDDDGDGSTNLEEYSAGTNPSASNSTFRIRAVRTEGGEIVIHIDAIAHRRYRIEAGNSPMGGFPRTIKTFGPFLTDTPIEIHDSIVPDQSRGYYRGAITR